MPRLAASLIAGLVILTGLAVLTNKLVRADSLPNTGAPQGFALTNVAEGLIAPTAAQFAPDGRIFVAEKGGAVKIVKDGQVLGQPFYTVPSVNDYVDRGLLGLALDPNFAANGYVYLLYTHDNNPSNIAGPKTGRLLRVTANGDRALAGSEQVILGTNVGNSVQTSCLDFPASSDCLPADGLSHAPGNVLFGPDGKLYVTVGDAAGYDDVDTNALDAQDITTLRGKVLRINPDGSGPSDNPYYTGDPSDNQSKVYASGVRNAFRMSIRPSDGLVLLGDVGWNTWEEINIVSRGANLGWPCYEGNDHQNGTGMPGIGAYKDQPFCRQMYANPPPNLTPPLHYYAHPPSSAVVSGVFYTGDNYPAAFKDNFFYGDYAKNQISTLQLDAANNLVPNSVQTFASNAGGPVQFFTGPDGDVYYIAINEGGIYHITYSTDNRAPSAFAAADKTYGPSPLAVNFTSSGSSDPEGDELSFAWDFGDGSPLSDDANPAHTFAADGAYTVTLTVTDEFNNTATKTLTIHAGQAAPDVTISSPTDMAVASPDDVINFAGSATDITDGVMPGSALRWQVTIHHCPLESCHIHNVQSLTGNQGSFTFPHHDGPFYIQISLSVTNSAGLTTTKSVSVYPTGQAITHAMQFDGINDYAQAAAPQDFRLQQFTAEAMIKTLTTDDWGSEIVSMGNNWGLRVMPNGNLQFSFNSNNTWQNLVASVNLKDGLWHHVAVTRSANAVKLYIDGAIRAQSENLNPIDYVYGGNFVVGRHGDGDDHFSFNGAIDEVRVWSAPRTDAQIEEYRTTTLPAAQANLLAYIPAEEGNGLIAADSSTIGAHNLTLINGANWTAGAPLSEPDTTPPVTTIPVTQIKDTFTGTVIDPEKWLVYDPASHSQQNDSLSVTANTTASGYYGIASKARYELKDNALFVEVPQTTTPGTTAETQFIAEPNESNKIVIGVTGNSLHLRHRVDDVNSDVFIPYDAAAMRWWQIREADGTVYLETSPDGLTWTTRRSFAKAFSLTSLEVILQAGTWQTVPNAGIARFDNLNTLPATEPVATLNHAISLNGTTGQAVISGGNHSHYAYQTLSLEAWVKVQATGTWGGEIASNGNNYGLRVLPDGNLRFFIHTGNLVWQNYETADLNVKDNTWHHVAAVKDSTSVKIYVDGQLYQTFASSEQISYTLGKDFVIGRHGDGSDDFNLTAEVDEVRVWSTARTAADIQANWQKELSEEGQSGLSAYWQFNDGAGTAAADSSGGHPLALSPGIAWTTTGFPKQ